MLLFRNVNLSFTIYCRVHNYINFSEKLTTTTTTNVLCLECYWLHRSLVFCLFIFKLRIIDKNVQTSQVLLFVCKINRNVNLVTITTTTALTWEITWCVKDQIRLKIEWDKFSNGSIIFLTPFSFSFMISFALGFPNGFQIICHIIMINGWQCHCGLLMRSRICECKRLENNDKKGIWQNIVIIFLLQIVFLLVTITQQKHTYFKQGRK